MHQEVCTILSTTNTTTKQKREDVAMLGRKLCVAALSGAATVLATGGGLAQTPEPAFANKTVTLVNGYAPGSGNDIIGRLVARHIGKHIPGQPRVVPQNMPGAGSYKAANYFYSVAPKDGTVLGYFAQTAATEELLGNAAVQFKTAKFNWIGRMSSYNNVSIGWYTSKVRSIADAQKVESTIGATGVGSAVYIYPNVMNAVLGTKFKIVSGYEGTAQSALAMERGEVDGVTMGWFTVKSTHKDWIEGKKINIFVQFLMERHPDLPDVPTIVEFARNPEEKQLFQLFANEGDIGKAILAPPSTPANVVTMLRRAFDDMAKDPEYIADADKLQLERDSTSGEKVQKLIEAVALTPPAVVEHAKLLLK
jgi:tripartite-type tricarboxylate transporter receptor subunit TctC